MDEIQKINLATHEATEVVAQAARDAAKVIANAASEALNVVQANQVNTGSDHDLLIKLETKMDALKEDIKDLKDGTADKMNRHEARIGCIEKMDLPAYIVKSDDHSKRLRYLENSIIKLYVMVGIGCGLLTFLAGLTVYHMVGK